MTARTRNRVADRCCLLAWLLMVSGYAVWLGAPPNSVREPLAVVGLVVAGLLYAAEELEHAKAARRWPR
jgi:hypothetical protein